MNIQNICHICGNKTISNPNKLGKRIVKRNDSHAHCPKCGIYYSNAANPKSRTYIWNDVSCNIYPKSSAGRLRDIIDNSMNEYVRPKKEWQMCHEHSEDALTWSVFNTLEDEGLIPHVYKVLSGNSSAPETCEVLYWGYNDRSNSNVADIYRDILEDAGESRTTYSEPDICLYAPNHGFMVIEVKYISGNDNKLKKRNYKRDMRAREMLKLGASFIQKNEPKEWIWWELLRMWVPGCLVAKKHDDIDFYLINLLPERMVAKEKGQVEQDMNECVKSSLKHKFSQVTWENFFKDLLIETSLKNNDGLWYYVHSRTENLTSLTFSENLVSGLSA